MRMAPGKKRSVAQAQRVLAISCGFMRSAAAAAACNRQQATTSAGAIVSLAAPPVAC